MNSAIKILSTDLLHKRFVTSASIKALLHFSLSKLANDKHFIAIVYKDLSHNNVDIRVKVNR